MKAWCTPLELGCRGFIERSVWTMSEILGMKGNNKKKLIKICKETSDRASIWIRLERNDVGLDTIVNSRMQESSTPAGLPLEVSGC